MKRCDEADLFDERLTSVPVEMTRYCAGCGCLFERRSTKQWCCSATCRGRNARKTKRASIATVKCASVLCGREVRRCRGRHYQRFCSRVCQIAHRNELRSRARAYKRQKRGVEWIAKKLGVSSGSVRAWLGL